MYTLHEFYTLTKGNEYLIAITFLLIFPVFWIFLNKKKKPGKQKVNKKS